MSTICNSNGVYFTLGSFYNDNNNNNDNNNDNNDNNDKSIDTYNTEPLQKQTKLKPRKRMLWATNNTQEDTSIFACIWNLLELNNII